MKRTAVVFMAAMALTSAAALAADFDLVAYTGNYVPAYDGSLYGGTSTIANLQYIAPGPNQWQRVLLPDGNPHQTEIFLFVSTDFTDQGVAGLDFNDPTSNPVSGIYSGEPGTPDPFVTINNRCRWAGKSGWLQIDGEKDPWGGNGATLWDDYNGYDAETDTFLFYPFNQYALGPLTEEGVPPYSNPYTNDWMKAVPLQWNAGQGYTNQNLGKNGVLVPYLHLVIDTTAMGVNDVGMLKISSLPALINGLAPQDTNFTLDWLGKTFNGQVAPWVPSGYIEFAVLPEPATLGLLALGGLPLLWRRRR